ncbi:DUF1905 domain-containing protein [Stackebrandtia nassauensis]|uniref:DUF1905 domain-containing protein n=1 Tax=Stackebrandtia nassauensis TaxID=283811 RepID=UPI001B7FA6DA
MEIAFTGQLWYWRGPAPWHFVTVPPEECALLADASATVTYGWGMIPVGVRINDTHWTTSLWPRDGGYIVPVKAWVRRAEGLDVGDAVTVELTVDALTARDTEDCAGDHELSTAGDQCLDHRADPGAPDRVRAERRAGAAGPDGQQARSHRSHQRGSRRVLQ